ncbi:MAG TPA: DUF4097 family beta strand repeat-containing protein [Pyrinomonadaceae bacterium]|jgi:hypothetical protein|nr:DUF4097 family beta strand repeat-containing protein [Pyrinomonadaceae bacterium]
MSERCSKCGSELFAGQQFCRRCGAAVGAAREDAPTQLFEQGASAGGPKVVTAPFGGGASTDAVGSRQPTAYQPTTSNQSRPTDFQPTSPLVGQPFGSQPLAVGPPARRKGHRGAWLVALLAVFVLGVCVVGGGGYAWWRARHAAIARKVIVTDVHVPDIPPPLPPPDFGEKLGAQIREAMKGAGAGVPLDESGATITGTDTVLTKTFEIGDDATFSVHGVQGNVTVTGTDGDQAEVKVTKHGGSPQERAGTHVLLSQTDKGLSLVSAAPPPDVNISYEVKLPRDLHQIEISSDRGDVKVEGFDGSVVVNVRQGDLEFRDVSGSVRSKLVNGSTRVFFDKAEREAGQEFTVVNGGIEATIADGTDADLKAETVNGDISVDERYGLKVEKRPAGRQVSGQLGDGGQSLSLKVVNGDIKLKK